MNSRMAAPSRKHAGRRIIYAGVLWVLTYGAAALVARSDAALALKLATATVSILTFGLFLFLEVQWTRSCDELQRRIQLEALAVAFPLSLLLLMALGILQGIIALPEADLSYRHIWPIMAIFYFVGLAFTTRRYQ